MSALPPLAALGTADLVGVAVGGGEGAAHAWRLLVERHVGLVWKVVRCFGLPQEAAWEAYQSTWLRAVEQLGALRDRQRFSSWLTTIARRETLGVIRARTRLVPTASGQETAAADPPPGEGLDRAELREAVRRGLELLSADCRDLLRLLSAEPQIPYEEIGRLLDMRHGSIGPTRRRCLEKLRSTPPMTAFLRHD